jgi:myo-inositol 2-dehydrogenase / D-chiro-inositol 1-dehydrogenase
MNEPIGVALLGCGSIAGPVHLRLLRRRRGVRVVGVADPAPEARAFAERAGVRAVADPLELLEDGSVGAAIVCAPTHAHAELGLAAVERRKHLYVEKPLATSVEDGCRLVDAAAKAGVVAAIGFNHRFHPLHVRARELVASGALGPVRAIQTAFCQPVEASQLAPWRRSRATGGGVLLDLASHQVDLVRWLLVDEIVSVAAELESEASEDDTARVELRTAAGVTVAGLFSYRAARCDVLRIVGTAGVLELDRYAPALRLSLSREDAGDVRCRRDPPASQPRLWQVRRRLRPSYEPSYERALGAFVDALHGKERPLPSLADGLRSLEVVVAAGDYGSGIAWRGVGSSAGFT